MKQICFIKNVIKIRQSKKIQNFFWGEVPNLQFFSILTQFLTDIQLKIFHLNFRQNENFNILGRGGSEKGEGGRERRGEGGKGGGSMAFVRKKFNSVLIFN